MCIRKQDGRPQAARFIDPRSAGHLAVAVEVMPGGEYPAGEVFSTRKNRGHSRSHGSLTHDEFAFPSNQRDMAHLDSGYIGDGIERAGGTGKWDTEITRPGLRSRAARDER